METNPENEGFEQFVIDRIKKVAETGFKTEAEIARKPVADPYPGIPGIIEAPDVGQVPDLCGAFTSFHAYVVVDKYIGTDPAKYMQPDAPVYDRIP